MSGQEEFLPKPDVRCTGHLSGGCPNCGRVRLEVYVDSEDERIVGVACEKCGANWLLDPDAAEYHGEQSTSNPLKPPPPENSPFEPPKPETREQGEAG